MAGTGSMSMQLLGAFQPSQLARARSDAKSSVVSDWRRAGKPITRLSEDVMDQLAQEPISEEKGSRPMLEVKWRLKACLHLDFSDAMFKLETFMPDDFVWGGLSGPGGGGGKATARSASKDAAETTMPVWKLISLDLSNNEIGDGDFVPDDPIKPKRALTGKTFVSLERLTLTHNKLEFPIIFMPTLKELNLSNNRIYRFPILAGLRKLEVLDLSHNVIEKLDETDFEDVEDLKDLDVSDNHIEIMPSELDLVLQRLGNLALSQVKLEENPFCLWFAEYQTLAVRHLSKKKTIQRLDDLNFELEPTLLNEMIEDSRNYFGDFQNEGARSKMLEKLDKEIKQRQCKKEKLDELEKTRKYKAMEGNVQVSRLSKHSHFEDVVQEMREATMHPNNMKAWVVLAFDLASKVMKDWMETGQSIFRLAAGTSQRSKTRDIEESRLVAEFSTLVMQIARASEESRSVLIRLIGKLCPAPSENLRDTCMSVLARIMQDEQTGGQEIRREAIRMLKETVIPLLEASGMEVDVGANVVKCLHTFLTITDAWEDNAIPLRQDIAIALRQVVLTPEQSRKIFTWKLSNCRSVAAIAYRCILYSLSVSSNSSEQALVGGQRRDMALGDEWSLPERSGLHQALEELLLLPVVIQKERGLTIDSLASTEQPSSVSEQSSDGTPTNSGPLPTTAMLRNMPNKYKPDKVVEVLNKSLKGRFDFVYVPMDFKNKCNLGYAFVNFRNHEAYKRFSEEFNGATLPLYKTHKVCEVSLARHQGYGVNVHRLRHNGKVMEQLIENPEWMPRLFDAAGNTVQFPPPLNSEAGSALQWRRR